MYSIPQDHFVDVNTDGFADNSPAVKISTEIMLFAVVFLFLVVIFLFVVYLYARRLLSPAASSLGRSRSRLVLAAEATAAAHRGLDATLLASLPITVYNSSEFKDKEPLECAVCLSEVTEGEQVRILPNCKHGFHLECIDMWFHSHSTCPLCRTSVIRDQSSEVVVAVPVEASQEIPSSAFPTNVLFWGTEDSVSSRDVPALTSIAGVGEREVVSVSSRGNGGLVIDIPSRRVVDGFVSPMSPLPTSRLPMEEPKSPPLSARFRSLRRLLSRGKTMAVSSSPKEGDVELGFGGLRGVVGESSSKTPKTVMN